MQGFDITSISVMARRKNRQGTWAGMYTKGKAGRQAPGHTSSQTGESRVPSSQQLPRLRSSRSPQRPQQVVLDPLHVPLVQIQEIDHLVPLPLPE